MEGKNLYEGVCGSRSTAITKAASVLKLYAEVMKKRKLKDASIPSPRAAAAEDPGAPS